MAELTEDITYQDPVPKQRSLADPDRAKLDSIVSKMMANKESDETIQAVVNDFKEKYSAAPTLPAAPVPASFRVKLDEPAYGRKITPFAPTGDTQISPSGITAPKEFSFDKPYDPLAVEKLKGKATEAQNKLHAELQGNDDEYVKHLREIRRDSYTIEDLRNDYRKRGEILAPQDEKEALKRAKGERYYDTITSDDLADIKTGTILDNQNSRKFINRLGRPDVNKNAYLVDKYNELANDPNGSHRVEKIKNVAKLIDKGAVIYDPESKVAIQPIGLIGSAIEGVKNKFKADEEHDFFKNASDATIINELESQRNNPDTDEPIKVPKGKAQEFIMSLSEMPIAPLAAGFAGTIGGTFIGNPEIGTIAATALGAYESRKTNYTQTFKQVYNELRDQGVSEHEAIANSRKQADYAQEVGTLVGGLQGYVGSNISAAPLRFSVPYQRSIGQVLKQAGSDLGNILMEGASQGGVAAAGEVAKNKAAQSIGINRSVSSGVADSFWSNLLMTVGIGAAIKAGRGMTKINYKTILHGISKVPESEISGVLQEKVKAGEVTQQAADQTLQRINEYKGKDAQIPANVTEEARFKIQDNIDKLNELEAQKETTHKSLQEPIKEKIQKLTEDNLMLSKEVEKAEKPETGLTKVQEKEAVEIAEEWLDEGILPESFGGIEVRKDPIGFWRFLSQQAHNMDESWRPLEGPSPEEGMRGELGETVIDYAKELFPAPELPTSTERVSIIQPGEINRPETITIKPKENESLRQRSPEATNVDETPINRPQMESGVSESGETTGTQEGQQRPTEEAGTAPSQEGQISEPEMVGITHAEMDKVSRELGLPEYSKDPESFDLWTREAKERLGKDPDAVNKLVNKLRNGEMPDPVETQMMKMHFAALKEKYNNAPSPELLAEMNRTKDLYNISGRDLGKSLGARKGLVPQEDSLADFHMRDVEFNRNAPLTDEQVAQSTKEYNEIKAARDAFEAKLKIEQEKNAKLKAEKKLEQEAKAIKKDAKKDYKEERKQILKDIGDKWRKSSKGDLGASFVPYAKELAAIAPDVMKLVKNVVGESVAELPKVIKVVHDQIKDIIPNISEKDVHDIIAGEYTKKQSRNQLATNLFDLKKEAQLMNQLDQLLKGEVPVNEKKLRQRNQRIEELRSQVKELKDEMGLNDKSMEEKLGALKGRYKSQIKDIEGKIARGEFGPDEKATPIKLDKEAIDLKDKLTKLKLDREARLAQQEYDNRTKFQKGKDLAADALDATRTIQTNPDLSFFGRQGIKYLVTHPIKGPRLFWESVKQAGSQRRYDRWLNDMHNSPAWDLMEKSGLAVLDPHTLHASKREEQWRSQLIHKIPIAGQVAKASERAFTSAANMARADWFMEGVNILEKQGKTFENSPEEYKGWASAVNNMTGRGGLGALEGSVGQLAIPFWSPRLIASNVNLFLNPKYYMSLPKTARTMLIKNMAQYVISGVAMLGLAKVLGADVEVDPRSSDFGKIKVGNTRYDIWGGAAQYIRALAQIFKAERKSNGGIQELDAKAQTIVGANLVRSKLSPLIGFGVDVTLGKNIVGEDVELKDAYKLMIPMLYNDIKEAYKDGGADQAAVSGLLSFLGIGAQTYAPKASKTSTGVASKKGKRTKLSKHSKN